MLPRNGLPFTCTGLCLREAAGTSTAITLHNQAAVCVGKGTITGPKIPRELAFPVGAGCEFTVHIDGFGKTGKIAKRVERDRAEGLTLPGSIVLKSHG